jgi:hypothetical protein
MFGDGSVQGRYSNDHSGRDLLVELRASHVDAVERGDLTVDMDVARRV